MSKRPLTIPSAVEVKDGIEWLTFNYTTKGISKSYVIRIDIDSIQSDKLPTNFKLQNCVYPKAFVKKERYAGNRWDYETSVNDIGWRLASLNDALVSKKGLIQRAVDSYRNRFPYTKSRRVARVERGQSSSDELDSSPRDSPKTESVVQSSDVAESSITELPASSNIPDTESAEPPTKKGRKSLKASEDYRPLVVTTVKNASPWSFEVNAAIDPVPVQTAEYRRNFKLFPNVSHRPPTHPVKKAKHDFQLRANDVAWRLALLNPSLNVSRHLLQRAVDCYLHTFEKESLKPRKAASEYR